MRISGFSCISICVSLATAAPLDAAQSSPAEVQAKVDLTKFQPELDEALRRGTMIYRYDQAAWHSTDAMLAAIKDPAKAGVVGWIVVDHERGSKAIYYGRDDEGLFAVYSAVWTGSQIVDAMVHEKGKEERLSPEENRIAGLLKAMPTDGLWFCSKQKPNVVIRPREKPDGVDSIYVLTPQPTLDIYAFGGHNRIDMKDGSAVSKRPFTKSCLNLGTKDKEKGEVVAFTMSHVLDPTPTEIHVFTALAANKEIYVATTANGIIWHVDPNNGQPKIRQMETPPK
jgi:hypothetical protein